MSTIEQSEGLLSIFKRLQLFFIIVYCLNYFHFTLASILNVYKPSIYLDISLQWQNKSFLIILLDLLAAARLAGPFAQPASSGEDPTT